MEGIVLSVVPYREKDAIVTILGDDDCKHALKVSGMFKMGSRSGALIQKHFHIAFQKVEAKGFPILTNVELKNAFPLLHQQLLSVVAADYICEWFEKCDVSLPFHLLQYYLNSLTIDFYRTLCLFQAFVNDMEGIRPHVDSCVRCGSTKNIAAISNNDGGFLCKTCAPLSSAQRTKDELFHYRILGKISVEGYDKLTNYTFDKSDFLNQLLIYEEYGSIRWKSQMFLKKMIQQKV